MSCGLHWGDVDNNLLFRSDSFAGAMLLPLQWKWTGDTLSTLLFTDGEHLKHREPLFLVPTVLTVEKTVREVFLAGA